MTCQICPSKEIGKLYSVRSCTSWGFRRCSQKISCVKYSNTNILDYSKPTSIILKIIPFPYWSARRKFIFIKSTPGTTFSEHGDICFNIYINNIMNSSFGYISMDDTQLQNEIFCFTSPPGSGLSDDCILDIPRFINAFNTLLNSSTITESKILLRFFLKFQQSIEQLQEVLEDPIIDENSSLEISLKKYGEFIETNISPSLQPFMWQQFNDVFRTNFQPPDAKDDKFPKCGYLFQNINSYVDFFQSAPHHMYVQKLREHIVGFHNDVSSIVSRLSKDPENYEPKMNFNSPFLPILNLLYFLVFWGLFLTNICIIIDVYFFWFMMLYLTQQIQKVVHGSFKSIGSIQPIHCWVSFMI